MPGDVLPLAPSAAPSLVEALAALLPPNLTVEQRERYAGIAAIVTATTDGIPHAKSEFVEPASVFDMHVRAPPTRR